MTTDTKAVVRWVAFPATGGQDGRHGDFVLFTDHEQVVAELRTALAASRAEVEGLLDVIADGAAALDRLGDRKMASDLMARWDAAMENNNV